MDDFLAGPDADGIDALELEIESLGIWLDVANDPEYVVETRANLTWREVAASLATRAVALGLLAKGLRDGSVRKP